MKKTFAELFKKYRLRAEFEKLSDVGNALSEKGLFYEDSIFSHWQKGTRIPNNRALLLKLLEIFIERKGIVTIDEANEFFESAHQGYLTKNELALLPSLTIHTSVFQVPHDTPDFTGREIILQKIRNLSPGRIIFIHGQPGIGKTALAIRLGHVLSETFSDGVLWYKIDSSRIMDILLSIASTFGEDISHIEDAEIRASVVRSILSHKKVLLILDSADNQQNLHLLLPNAPSCLTIITSRNSHTSISESYVDVPLMPFTGEEVLQLFTNIFAKQFVSKNQKNILAIGEKAGNLPLAVHMLAKQLQQSKTTTSDFLNHLEQQTVSLKTLSYEDKNLYLAIQLSYNSLSDQEKIVFISLGIFEGKDFSLEAVAYINNLHQHITEKALENSIAVSLIECSTHNRYRIHPMIKQFAREKLTSSRHSREGGNQDIQIYEKTLVGSKKLYISAAKYYEKLLADNKGKKNFKALLKLESDNIIHIFNACYKLEYWDEVTKLWNPIEKYLDTPIHHNKIHPLKENIDIKSKINIWQKILLVCLCINFIYLLFLQVSGLKTSFWNYFYSSIYTFTPLFGGIIGIFIAKLWGIRKSTLGKAILFISLGLFSWGVGNLFWSYYNFFENISVPYPSLADAGYIISYPCWIIGIIYLSRATGVKFELRKKSRKLLSFIIPLFVTISTYYFLIEIVKGGNLINNNDSFVKVFFDFAYPTGDIIILSASLIILGISFQFFGGKYKKSLYILLVGFVCMYIADSLFSFTTTNNTYYNGSIADVFFTTGLSLITFGIFGFYRPVKNK